MSPSLSLMLSERMPGLIIVMGEERERGKGAIATVRRVVKSGQEKSPSRKKLQDGKAALDHSAGHQDIDQSNGSKSRPRGGRGVPGAH